MFDFGQEGNPIFLPSPSSLLPPSLHPSISEAGDWTQLYEHARQVLECQAPGYPLFTAVSLWGLFDGNLNSDSEQGG